MRIRLFLCAFVVTVLLSLGCGGSQTKASTVTASPAAQATTRASTTPALSVTATPQGALRIVSLSSPVRRGQSASLVAQAEPNASCTISYRTPAGTQSVAQGLAPKAADGGGNVSWSWVIGTATNPGTGSVTITCAGQAATTPIDVTS